jgi:class 3 adenylate cyclase
MTCDGCGEANRAGARFCNGCGAKLGAPAPAPARELRTYTPPHLAERILRSRSALEGERKQVTVLFADVRESMVLAESLGMETWHATLDRFFAVLSEVVHRFEGTINQYTGDGVMALFGAPLALEDHAERACACALALREPLRRLAHDLRREYGLDFAVRMGLHSGEVVVGRIGDDLRMDYTAQGAVVGTAQRIEQLSEAGRPYLSETTARLVEGYFALEDQGELALRGVRTPMRVFALDGVGPLSSRLERSRRRGFSRFVGRERELALLEEALARASGGASRVAIVGEAGSGKSRLCHEFVLSARARGTRVLGVQCVARADPPLAPVRELLAGLVGLREGDLPLEARRKIAGALLLADPALQPDLPGIFSFFGVADPERPAPPAEPGSLEQQIERIAALLLQASVERGPIVVSIEDVHWCDALSERVLVRLRANVAEHAILWLDNARPGASEALLGGSLRVPLAPLGPEAVAALLDDLVGIGPSLDAIKAGIRDRAGGNPFFVEELVLAAVETGALVGQPGARRVGPVIAVAALPATVQAVLAARIDRLDEPEKLLLGVAAVIGREVSEALLREIAGMDGPTLARARERLEQAELLLEVAPAPQRVLRFKHPLTQEVAYSAQLSGQRARVHAAAARALEREAESAPDALAAVVAQHFQLAGESLASARWQMRAAFAAERHDAHHAVARWRTAYQALCALPRTREIDELALEAACGLAGAGFYAIPAVAAEELAAHCATALERARELSSHDWLAALHAHAAALALLMRDFGAVFENSDRALEHVQHSEDPSVRAGVHARLAYSDLNVRGMAEALRRIERALAQPGVDERMATRAGFRDSPRVRLMVFRAYALNGLGRLTEAESLFQEVHAISVRQGHVASELASQVGYASLLRQRGEGDAALSVSQGIIARAVAVGAPYWRAGGLQALSYTRALRGEWATLIAEYDEAAGLVNVASAPGLRALRAEALWRIGDLDRARECADALEPHFLRSDAVNQLGPTHRYSARLSLARVRLGLEGVNARARIEALIDRQAELVRRDESTIGAAFIALERAALARALGNATEVRSQLEFARAAFAAAPAPRMVDEVDRELAR